MDSMPTPKLGRLWKPKVDFFRPFRTATAEGGENIEPLYDPALHSTTLVQPDLQDLNVSLGVLMEVFPDVEPEVFRKMLSSLSPESRVQVVIEHLLKKKPKWMHEGRRLARREKSGIATTSKGGSQRDDMTSAYVNTDKFQSEEYKTAVKQVFYQEFRSLGHSTIKGVMAEQNYSYSLARPILQAVAAKSWRSSIPTFWPRRSPSTVAGDHPYIIWQATGGLAKQQVPAVKRTGSIQLDHELYELFVEPVVSQQRDELRKADYAFATRVNETEAKDAEALFDCECCYGSVTFEEITVCDDGSHQLCASCIRRSVNEALYGQGFAKTADLMKSTVRCFAPSGDDCHGSVPAILVRRALADGEENKDVWNDFQARIANETLAKSRVKLLRCPFCNYAEIDEIPKLRMRSAREIWNHLAKRSSPALRIIILSTSAAVMLFTIPLLLLACIAFLITQILPPAARIVDASLSRVYKRRRGFKFKCLSPSCSKTSCTRCSAAWRDPHTCFDSEKTSLRTAIESSATAAIKRTCPKCLLSFVKSSGCNKLVCNCGYTMCYICRQEITKKEGYAHFCQHFRPSGGRCTECERCDLYGDEDEELAIRRAAEAAEKAWSKQQGAKDDIDDEDEGVRRLMVEAFVGQARRKIWYESYLDGLIDALVE